MCRLLFLLLAVLVAATTAKLTDECLCCMCCASSDGCKMPEPLCYHGWLCGPFDISYGYWFDGGELLGDFQKCMADWDCNQDTVRNYMDRYVTNSSATCETYARTHMGGPWSPGSDSATKYWAEVESCLQGNKNCNPIPTTAN